MEMGTGFSVRRDDSSKDVENQQKIKRAEADADLRWLALDIRGRRLLRRFFKFSCLFHSAMDTVRVDSPNAALAIAAEEGRKTTAFEVFREVRRVAPEALAKLLNEQEEKAHG
jgi:hypothetical protein